jgi:beta-galactosidase
MGQNYQMGGYAKFRTENPTIPLVGSETSSCVSSRGEYVFETKEQWEAANAAAAADAAKRGKPAPTPRPFEPVSNDKSRGRADFQMSSYDLYAPSWAMPPDWEFAALAKNPHVAGEFVWTGFDYLGEPTPYNSDQTNLLNFHDAESRAKAEKELKDLGKIRPPSRSSYFGIVDLAGFKKDRFFLYQALWRPELPMAHLLPHWNWPERIGQVTPVHVYTSGDEAELFLNGTSLGRKTKGANEYRLRWDDVVYAPGELRVIAYKSGKSWAVDTVKTTGAPSRVLLSSDRGGVTADRKDLAFVTVTIADAAGLQVPRSKNPVVFTISGPGEVVAVDNGDATSHAPFQAMDVKAYNGLALAIIRATGLGPITLTASSEGLAPAKVVITGR